MMMMALVHDISDSADYRPSGSPKRSGLKEARFTDGRLI